MVRYHESFNTLTPADVDYDCGANVLDMRQKIKQRVLSEETALSVGSIPFRFPE